MKKMLPLFLFSFLVSHLYAQHQEINNNLYPVAGQVGWGFSNIISGMKLDYPPVLQKGNLFRGIAGYRSD